MIRARRDLGHVHRRLQARLFSRGGEGRGCLEKAICDWVREVRTLDPIECRAHGLEVVNIADGDFGAERPELVGPVISLTNEGSNRQPHCEQLPRGVVAGRTVASTRTDNQEACGPCLRHLSSSLSFGAIRPPTSTPTYCPSASYAA